jgi:hypothetical protein
MIVALACVGCCGAVKSESSSHRVEALTTQAAGEFHRYLLGLVPGDTECVFEGFYPKRWLRGRLPPDQDPSGLWQLTVRGEDQQDRAYRSDALLVRLVHRNAVGDSERILEWRDWVLCVEKARPYLGLGRQRITYLRDAAEFDSFVRTQTTAWTISGDEYPRRFDPNWDIRMTVPGDESDGFGVIQIKLGGVEFRKMLGLRKDSCVLYWREHTVRVTVKDGDELNRAKAAIAKFISLTTDDSPGNKPDLSPRELIRLLTVPKSPAGAQQD